MTVSDVTLTSGDRAVEVPGGTSVAFGRSRRCAICLDPDDVGVSRRAGAVEAADGRAWLTNLSRHRPLTVRSDLGLRDTVRPGRVYALDAPATLLVEGAARQYQLTVEVPWTRPSAARVASGTPTAGGDGVVIRADDRTALVAMFAGYLHDPPRYRPEPRSYDAAASRLGWSSAKVRRRIEYLRERLTAAGVPGLVGDRALEHLADYAITTGRITRDDLDLLPR